MTDLELSLPSSTRKMRTAHVPSVLSMDPKLLQQTPLVVSYAPGRVICLFDEPALKTLYPRGWPAIQALLGELQPRAAHAELLELEKKGALSPQAIAVLRQAEAALLDTLIPDPAQPNAGSLALAHLVALLVQHKLTEIIARTG
jgi:hypothetical protein